ncbi:MAG: dihydropteroate synthase [Deltaproteobacteria bacterium]|nr:dihydropteroate synthase [Deltaproteobacteria bacterium]
MRNEPLIMGILNVTPDSFSDGGLYFDRNSALDRARQMSQEGADIIDVGAESTRPGAMPVNVQEELNRVLPVLDLVKPLAGRISIDTTKYEVAREAVEHGASILNDVSGGSDIRMAELAAEHSLDVILMHRQGTPATMQVCPEYPQGVVHEVFEYLSQRARKFEEAGVVKEKIWVDVGIGFGKTFEQNCQLLRHLDRFNQIAGRVVIGTSRKSFLGKMLGEEPALPVDRRCPGTLASNLWAYSQGASVFRVHDVGEFKLALTTWRKIVNVSD